MITYRNECMNCENGCMSCGLSRVKVYICDDCNEETTELYDVDGTQICEDCLKERFDMID